MNVYSVRDLSRTVTKQLGDDLDVYALLKQSSRISMTERMNPDFSDTYRSAHVFQSLFQRSGQDSCTFIRMNYESVRFVARCSLQIL